MAGRNQGKDKFPELQEPPEFPHTLENNLSRGANQTTIWWDCKTCENRVVQTNKQTSITKYFAVPACAGTPGASKLTKAPVPPTLQEQIPTPPSWRKPQKEEQYTEAERTILEHARAIIEAKHPKTGPAPESTARGSTDAAPTATSKVRSSSKRRTPPKSDEVMPVSSDSEFEPVIVKTKPQDPTIEEISSQINELTFLLQAKQAEKAKQNQQ